MWFAGQRLDHYLGSQHSAVGLLLFWFGVPALVGGTIFAVTAADEISFWQSASTAAWGLLAIPLGISMRRRHLTLPFWVLANLLLGGGFLTLLSILTLGK